ncbi:predicted protein [Coccidioides posadasii str. Silveira]|uniref:Predicted protein n=1 Tax=Coccidioides posadasii (strain RMSCC 757 / Silveira) TaxID=443226 RepID=E9CZN7_COCPS|nr:predicted protein [Coccidioides posadasii str. Silveira]
MTSGTDGRTKLGSSDHNPGQRNRCFSRHDERPRGKAEERYPASTHIHTHRDTRAEPREMRAATWIVVGNEGCNVEPQGSCISPPAPPYAAFSTRCLASQNSKAPSYDSLQVPAPFREEGNGG